jgi:hypothetical protein
MTASPQTAPTAPLVQRDLETRPRCIVCEHDLPAHDTISLRYCQATQTHALTRACICPTSDSSSH